MASAGPAPPAIAYETVEDAHGRLPLLAPMSEIAGKIATQAGAFMLEKPLGGRGILLGGVPGVAAANVMVIGGGVVGMNAAFIAIGMEADVFVFDRSIDRLRELDVAFGGRCSTVYSTTLAVEEMLPRADLVIGAVLVHGARAPYVVRREQLALMKPGAVLVDVAIDQGGCFETSRPTTHRDPTFEVDGITHYCVANMPGAVPITSTHALTNATLPYAIALADHGVAEAIRRDPGLRPGVNVAAGKVTHPAVAEGVGMDYVPVEEALGLEPTLKLSIHEGEPNEHLRGSQPSHRRDDQGVPGDRRRRAPRRDRPGRRGVADLAELLHRGRARRAGAQGRRAALRAAPAAGRDHRPRDGQADRAGADARSTSRPKSTASTPTTPRI